MHVHFLIKLLYFISHIDDTQSLNQMDFKSSSTDSLKRIISEDLFDESYYLLAGFRLAESEKMVTDLDDIIQNATMIRSYK